MKEGGGGGAEEEGKRLLLFSQAEETFFKEVEGKCPDFGVSQKRGCRS